MLNYEATKIDPTETEGKTDMKIESAKPKNQSVIAMLDEAVELKKGRTAEWLPEISEGEQWIKLVERFRSKITSDQKAFTKHEVAGRSLLYSQLADAYKIGLELVSDERFSNLSRLSRHHNMDEAVSMINTLISNQDARKDNEADGGERKLKAEVSPWVYVVKILYGKWIDTKTLTNLEKNHIKKEIGKTDNLQQYVFNEKAPEEAKSIYQEWSPNRSAEKYAVVFRYLHNHNVKSDDIASYIEAFNDAVHGKRLAGIESASRAEASRGRVAKAPSQTVTEQQKAYVSRAESRDNWNVFEVPKPSTFPSTFTYARAVLKKEGDCLVLVLVDEEPMNEKTYINQAVKLGKPLYDKEQEQVAERSKKIAAINERPEVYTSKSVVSQKMSQLIADGYSDKDLDEELQEFLDMRSRKIAERKAMTSMLVAE